MRPAPKSPEQLIRLSPEVGAKPPESFWSYDFIEHFNEAYGSLEDLQSVSIETACCGGIPKRAIYQHPPPQGKSVIRYFVPIPEAVGIFRLECFIGIKDGSEIDRDPKNVVLFEVAVGGTWAVLSETYAGKRWARVNRGPIPGSGEYTSIEFITDACGNNEWDWAVWGEPKLVQVE